MEPKMTFKTLTSMQHLHTEGHSASGADVCSNVQGISSRDLKLENLLLDRDGTDGTRPLLKICDFGYSKVRVSGLLQLHLAFKPVYAVRILPYLQRMHFPTLFARHLQLLDFIAEILGVTLKISSLESRQCHADAVLSCVERKYVTCHVKCGDADVYGTRADPLCAAV